MITIDIPGPPYKQTEYTWLIVALAHMFKVKLYVELGVKNGYTFNQVAPVVKRAIGVDIKPGRGVKKRDNIYIYPWTTEKFIEWWPEHNDNQYIDMVFIDADHNYKAVLEDVSGIMPYVKPDTGLILMHDTYPVHEELMSNSYCGSAYKIVKDMKKLNKEIEDIERGEGLEVLTLPGPWAGLTILRKTTKELYWRDAKSLELGEGARVNNA